MKWFRYLIMIPNSPSAKTAGFALVDGLNRHIITGAALVAYEEKQ